VASVRRTMALVTLVFAVLGLLAAPAVAATSGPRTTPATPAPPSASGAAASPRLLAQSGDEAVQGTLRDAEGEPVEGAVITVSTADGEVIGEAVSDAEGNWTLPIPAGPGAYVATLDQATLPEGAALRDPERDTLEFELRTGQQRTLLFPIGEGGTAGTFLDRLLAQTLSGLRFGLIIAITALGLSLIFGTTGLVNFAHGELVTLGAVLAWFLNAPTPTGLGLTLIVAGILATILSAGAGGAIELGLWRPLRRRRTGLIQMLVISIGLALVLRNLIQIWFGGSSRPYFDYTIQQPWTLGPLRLTPRDAAVMLLATLTLVGIATMLQRTRIGKAMRAVADNRDLAESSGIDVQRVILVVWVIGGGLAGFGGILYGLSENVSYLMGFRLLLLMFAGVILGGLGTAYGAMVGSIVVGLVTELSTLFFSTELKFVWALVVLILILLVRPQGLLGRRERIG
jgi:neutral amino acid transport system permease protein